MKHPAELDEAELSCDMLGENDDLLQQLSHDIGLPDFMDDDEADRVDLNSLNLLDQLMNENKTLFSDSYTNETDASLFSPESLSIKSEPFSPASPSGLSTSSSLGSDQIENKDLLAGIHTPISPPHSPPNQLQQQYQQVLQANQSHPQRKIATATSTHQGQQGIQLMNGNVAVVNGGSVLAIPDLSNVKIPIPKVSKPIILKTSNAAPVSTSTQPLILSPSQLAQLTKQGGILRVTQATPATSVCQTSATTTSPAPLIIKTEPSVATPTTSSTIGVPFSNASNSSDIDLKTLKRQQRMIKNRESACLSRKKKKEYVSSLEEQIKQLGKENQMLKQENEVLKAKVRELESEKVLWTDTVLNGSNLKKGVTTLFAVFLIFSVNFASQGLYKDHMVGNRLQSDMNSVPSAHMGRTLLWANESDMSSEDWTNTSSAPICPMFLNRSESKRLEDELRGWFKIDANVVKHQLQGQEDSVDEVVEEKEVALVRGQARASYKRTSENSLDYYNHHSAARRSSGKTYPMVVKNNLTPEDSHHHLSSGGALSLYNSNTPRFSYQAFFEAIDRQEDTFYVVSFSGDHLLLPASDRNQTSRPRMSLIMPFVSTMALNDSMKPPAHHIAMMQIDCEVMNTRMLYIKEDAIPINLSAHMRSGNSSLQRNQSRNQHHNATSGDEMNSPSSNTESNNVHGFEGFALRGGNDIGHDNDDPFSFDFEDKGIRRAKMRSDSLSSKARVFKRMNRAKDN